MSVVSLKQLTFQRIGWCVKKAHCQPACPYSFGERSYLSFVVRRVRDEGLPVILNVATCFSWRSEWISLFKWRGPINEKHRKGPLFERGNPSTSFVPPLLFSLPEVSGQAGMSLSRHLHPEPCTYPLQFFIFVVSAKSIFYFYEHRFFQHQKV